MGHQELWLQKFLLRTLCFPAWGVSEEGYSRGEEGSWLCAGAVPIRAWRWDDESGPWARTCMALRFEGGKTDPHK